MVVIVYVEKVEIWNLTSQVWKVLTGGFYRKESESCQGKKQKHISTIQLDQFFLKLALETNIYSYT